MEKQEQYGYTIMDAQMMPDHVHLLLDVDPRIGVERSVAKIKGDTSHELFKEFTWLRSRPPTLRTRSNLISSVGAITQEIMQAYIENQEGI